MKCLLLPTKTANVQGVKGVHKFFEKNSKKHLHFEKKCGNIHLAERNSKSLGGIAQLGERLTGSQEVRGSIPLISTKSTFFIMKDVDFFVPKHKI